MVLRFRFMPGMPTLRIPPAEATCGRCGGPGRIVPQGDSFFCPVSPHEPSRARYALHNYLNAALDAALSHALLHSLTYQCIPSRCT